MNAPMGCRAERQHNCDLRRFSSTEHLFKISKQGVALTGRNTTGPPRAAPGKLRCAVECYRRRQTTTDARRAKQYCPLHYV